MKFIADRAINTDGAVYGRPAPTDKTDDHSGELIIRVS